MQRLQIEQGAPLDPNGQIECIEKPTAQLPPPAKGSTAWRLVSQLSLNHLSLSDGEDSLSALKEILRLYASPDNQVHDQLIDGITEMTCRPVLRHLGADPLQSILDQSHDLGSSFVAFGELIPAILCQRLHSFADASLRVADFLENLVHLRLQPLQFVAAHFVDFIG